MKHQLDTQELEYLESEISSCCTEDRSENSSNESVILDFLKLNLCDLEPVQVFVRIRAWE